MFYRNRPPSSQVIKVPPSRPPPLSLQQGDPLSQYAINVGKASPKQVGLVRVVTDDVTFAYLTDIYILPEHHGRGLGRWMLECLGEIVRGWKYLRRFMFLTTDAMDLYRTTLGAKSWDECETEGISIGLVEGPAAQRPSSKPSVTKEA